MRMKCISSRHNMHEEKIKTPSIQSIHCENICTKSKSLSPLIALISCGCLCCSFTVMGFKVNTPLSLRYVLFLLLLPYESQMFSTQSAMITGLDRVMAGPILPEQLIWILQKLANESSDIVCDMVLDSWIELYLRASTQNTAVLGFSYRPGR